MSLHRAYCWQQKITTACILPIGKFTTTPLMDSVHFHREWAASLSVIGFMTPSYQLRLQSVVLPRVHACRKRNPTPMKRMRESAHCIDERGKPLRLGLRSLQVPLTSSPDYVHSGKQESTPTVNGHTLKEPVTSARYFDSNSAIQGQIWPKRQSDMSASWDQWYAVLEGLKQPNGQQQYMRITGPNAGQLTEFMGYCRRAAARGILSQDRIDKLNRIGFEWDASEAAWKQQFESLLDFKMKYGTFAVRVRRHPSLSQWIRHQRYLHRRGKLPAHRENMLIDVGFPFKPHYSAAWGSRYQELIQFKQRFGDVQVLDKDLSNWLSRQRSAFQKGLLSKERSSLLAQVGVSWQPHDDLWSNYFEDLVAFKKKHGHCNVPQRGSLGKWVHRQRVAYCAGKLPKARVHLLEELNFTWNVHETAWNRKFEALRQYVETQSCQNGGTGYDNPYLKWIQNQRQAHRRGSLSRERESLLTGLGVLHRPRYKKTVMR